MNSFGGDITILNSNFTDFNQALYLYRVNSLVISNIDISNGSTTKTGGFLYCEECSSLSLSNSTISNVSAKNGGALALTKGTE